MNKIKLNVYLAHAGLCSRRKADELIKQGQITINHAVMKQSSYIVQDKDTVRHLKQVVTMGKIPLITIAVNKPTDVITTVSDEQHRQTILSLVSKKIKHRIYPIGRLDRNTTGVILMTNDGALAQKLAHPKFKVKKIYQVFLNKDLSSEHLDKIKNGLQLKDGPIKVDSISRALNKRHVRVSIHSGRNRIVRRIFEALGYTIRRLDRTSFAGITKKNLELGDFRYLKHSELNKFKKLTPSKLSKFEITNIQRSKPAVLDTINKITVKKPKPFSFADKYGTTNSRRKPKPYTPKPFESSDENNYYGLEKVSQQRPLFEISDSSFDKPQRSDSRRPRSDSYGSSRSSDSSNYSRDSRSSSFDRPERSNSRRPFRKSQSNDSRRNRSESDSYDSSRSSDSHSHSSRGSRSSSFERPKRSGSGNFRKSNSSGFKKSNNPRSQFKRNKPSGSSR
jgi:23S rRNA pseudouridine2605 synthase